MLLYILYVESYEQECKIHVIIINKPQIIVAFVQDIYALLLAKWEIGFQIATFGGSLFSGGGIATFGIY